MADNLELALKIKALVEGIKNVEGLANEIKALGDQAGKAAGKSGPLAESGDKITISWSKVGAVAGAAIGAIAVALFKMTKSAIDSADAMGKTADKLGLTVEALSALGYTAKLADVSQESLNQSLQFMQRNLADAAQGAGEAADAFADLGLSAQALIKLSPDQAFAEIAEAMERIPNQADRVNLAMKIFGRSGADMINVMRGGKQALAESAEEARKFGAVIDTQAAKAAEQFNDNLTRLKTNLSSVGITIMKEVVPALTRMTDAMLGQESLDTLQRQRAALATQYTAVAKSGSFAMQQLKQNILKEIDELDAKIIEKNRRLQSGLKQNAGDDGGLLASRAAELERQRLEISRSSLKSQTILVGDELARQQALIERSLESNLVSYREFYERRTQLQQEAIDQNIRAVEAQIAQEQAALANTNKEDDRIPLLTKIKELETQLIILRRQRADVAVQADHEETQSTLQLLNSLDQVRERLQAAQGQTAAARRSALEREFTPLVARLEAEGDKAGIAIVEKLINTEVAKIRLDEFHQTYNQTLQEMQTTENDINAQRDAGLIGEIEARRRIIDLHKATNAELAEMIPKMQEAAAAAGPEAQQQVQQLAEAWRRLGSEIDPIAQRINTSIRGGLTDSLYDFIRGAATASEAFQSFARSVIAAIQRIAAEKLAESIFSGFNLGAIGGFFGGLFHSGGVVGAGGTKRLVSPLAFIGAPRYHSGGIAGLKPDEVPAILQTGEQVLSRDQVRGAKVVTPVNVTITVNNTGTPQQVNGVNMAGEADNIVANIITSDLLRGGPISGTMSRVFNLNRGS